MSYIGTNKMGKMYLGNTAIGKAYLGEDLVYDSAGGGITPVLPYDAKVEYLESTGTQYINTGIIPDSTTGISIHLTASNNNDQYFVGLRQTYGNTRWCIGRSAAGYYYGYGGYSQSSGISTLECYAELNWLGSGKFYTYLGSTTKQTTLPSLPFSPTYNIRLFGSAGVSASYSKASCKLFDVKISQGSTVVMELIPVRVGQVGYMYDKVSGELFGNNGTGSFTLGNDK